MAANYVHYQEFFKKFLGGWSFENGDETLTISAVDEKQMYDQETDGKKTGLVIYFEEKDLPMVLNQTNAETIAEVTGTSVLAEWVGKKIVVGSRKVKAFGQIHDAIRVQNTKPDEDVLICDDCGDIITAAAGKQPSELAAISKRNTGRVLCIKCMKKAKEAEQEAETDAE